MYGSTPPPPSQAILKELGSGTEDIEDDEDGSVRVVSRLNIFRKLINK